MRLNLHYAWCPAVRWENQQENPFLIGQNRNFQSIDDHWWSNPRFLGFLKLLFFIFVTGKKNIKQLIVSDSPLIGNPSFIRKNTLKYGTAH